MRSSSISIWIGLAILLCFVGFAMITLSSSSEHSQLISLRRQLKDAKAARLDAEWNLALLRAFYLSGSSFIVRSGTPSNKRGYTLTRQLDKEPDETCIYPYELDRQKLAKFQHNELIGFKLVSDREKDRLEKKFKAGEIKDLNYLDMLVMDDNPTRL